MRPNQIEAWTLLIAERIMQGRPVEDSRVEVKSRWPDDVNGAARRIAGHINAAQGEPILWIIGIDEENREVVGADRKEMAAWYSQVQAEFSELYPAVTDLNVPFNNKVIVALAFDTDRPPFVVRNLAFGKQGTPVSHEVPWREGTKVRTARRADLIRMLTPLEGLPKIQLLGMFLLGNNRNETTLSWRLTAQIYISSKTRGQMIFPFHSCSATADIGDDRRRVSFNGIGIMPNPRPDPGVVSTPTIQYSQTEIIVAGAGMITFYASAETQSTSFGNNIGDPAHIRIELTQAHDDRPITVSQTIKSDRTPRAGNWGAWGVEFRT